LLLHFHGWGEDLEAGAGFHTHGISQGFIVASPLGFSDAGTRPPSWNLVGSGSASSQICYDPDRRFSGLCYNKSCGGRCGESSCGWTTCEDSVAQVATLLRELDRALCFDEASVFASGVSNGGVFLYALAASELGKSFAGFMPVIGSPPHGFSPPPRSERAPFFGVWGRADVVMPARANPQVKGHPGDTDVSIDTIYGEGKGGWLYKSSDSVSRQWAAANRCENATLPGTVSGCGGEACTLARLHDAVCVGWSAGCFGGAQVVHCLHNGGHSVPYWVPSVQWAFMRQHRARLPSSAHNGELQWKFFYDAPHVLLPQWWLAAALLGTLVTIALAIVRHTRPAQQR
jgi:poly(3-hydroxybutyrate) depolymerase